MIEKLKVEDFKEDYGGAIKRDFIIGLKMNEIIDELNDLGQRFQKFKDKNNDGHFKSMIQKILKENKLQE